MHQSGYLYWGGREVFVSETLWGERLGLEAIDEGVWQVWFGPVALGRLDERRGKFAPFPRRRGNGPRGAAREAAAAPAANSVKSPHS